MESASHRQPLVGPTGPPRRLTRRPLPAYRHVPGLTPHPINDPRGHSYAPTRPPAAGPAPPPAGAALPAGWRRCQPYLYGIDLFNRAYLWEAHEEWEALWHAAGHDTVPGRYLQGLIQTAAALLQRHLGHRRGVRYLAARSAAHLEPARRQAARGGSTAYMGVDLAAWPAAVACYLAGDSTSFPFLDLDLGPAP